jgi:hypothetical protein
MVSSIHTYIGSKFHIVHPTKSKQKGRTRRRVDSINASFRDLKQICKLGKKKVRRRTRRRRRRRRSRSRRRRIFLLFLFLLFFIFFFF